jgi:hypothetical protein
MRRPRPRSARRRPRSAAQAELRPGVVARASTPLNGHGRRPQPCEVDLGYALGLLIAQLLGGHVSHSSGRPRTPSKTRNHAVTRSRCAGLSCVPVRTDRARAAAALALSGASPHGLPLALGHRCSEPRVAPPPLRDSGQRDAPRRFLFEIDASRQLRFTSPTMFLAGVQLPRSRRHRRASRLPTRQRRATRPRAGVPG